MRFGLQMYGVTNEWRPAPAAFFRMIAQNGFGMIEPCIAFSSLADAYQPFFMLPQELCSYMPLLNELDITVSSVHLLSANWKADQKEMIDLAKKCGIRHYVIKFKVDPEDRKAIDAYAADCMELADALAGEGIGLLLHNEDEEFRHEIDDMTAFEYLVEACQGKVGIQPDVGWMLAAGTEPVAFLQQYRDLIGSLHYKDFRQVCEIDEDDLPQRGDYVEAAVGFGDVNTEGVFRIGAELGVQQIIDSDTCPLSEILASLHLLQGLAEAYDKN